MEGIISEHSSCIEMQTPLHPQIIAGSDNSYQNRKLLYPCKGLSYCSASAAWGFCKYHTGVWERWLERNEIDFSFWRPLVALLL